MSFSKGSAITPCEPSAERPRHIEISSISPGLCSSSPQPGHWGEGPVEGKSHRRHSDVGTFFFPLPSPAKVLLSIYSSYCVFASAQQEAAPINSSEHFCCVMTKGAWMQTARKMDSVKTSHNLICQRNKWEEQEEYPRPHPTMFYLPQPFTTGSPRAASACDCGRSGQRNSIYLKFTSYKRISYINAAPG